MPQVLASKCDGTTCTALTADMAVVKACFTDPTDTSSCKGKLFNLNVCMYVGSKKSYSPNIPFYSANVDGFLQFNSSI